MAKRYLSSDVDENGDSIRKSDSQTDSNMIRLSVFLAATSGEAAEDHAKNLESHTKNISRTRDEDRFAAARDQEINGLIARGVFTPISSTATSGYRIYNSRFVDVVRNEGQPGAFEKSRLVVQAFMDKKNDCLPMHLPCSV